ncbi:MAG TPA: Crp/Fnr family transcriptional regulator [Candidatus Sulfotelmatobacter sp.]|jgi:CRP/FNR family cyclic AMP-dependent transcriptional regulator|nr:Crp/Fnr family transcriptional regulator [Candidatus Sulfotelmatobacter sp.]
MNPPADASPTGQAASVPAAPELSEVLSQSLYDLIEQQPFFKGLDSRQLKLLTGLALEIKFEPGQSIFDQGSPANRFYLIVEGEVVVESEKDDHSAIPIQTLGPGDALGWSWLFPPYYLHFSARAVKPTRTIFFYGTGLREHCEQDHELGYQIMKRIAEVASQSLQATQQRLMNFIATNTTPNA